MTGELLGHMVVHGSEHGPQADYDGLIHATAERAQAALQDARREFPAESWYLAEVHESPTREGPPCYTLNPDGTTNAARQCVDPDCTYPNPHTHPDLVQTPTTQGEPTA